MRALLAEIVYLFALLFLAFALLTFALAVSPLIAH